MNPTNRTLQLSGPLRLARVVVTVWSSAGSVQLTRAPQKARSAELFREKETAVQICSFRHGVYLTIG